MKNSISLKILIAIWGMSISLIIYLSLSLSGILGEHLNLYPQVFFMAILLFNSLILFDCSKSNKLNYPISYVLKRSVFYLPFAFILVWFSGYFFLIIDSIIAVFSAISIIISGVKLYKFPINNSK